MPEPKKVVDNTSNNDPKKIDVSKLEGDDVSLHEKSSRKADAIKQVFIDNYGFADGDPYLDKMVEREMTHGKSISKLIRQKITLRNEKIKKASNKDNVDNKDNKDNENKVENEVLVRNRKKAAESFLDNLKKKNPDLGIDIKSTYKKLKENYKETGTETSVEDFTKAMQTSFETTYPELHEETIRKDERNKVRESDEDIMDFSSSTNKSGDGEGQPKERILKSTKVKPATWYKGDKKK